MFNCIMFVCSLFIVGCTGEKTEANSLADGSYKITQAFALVHDMGPISAVHTELAGAIITISKGEITIMKEKYIIEREELLSRGMFDSYHSGINYSGISSSIFGNIGKEAKISVLHLSKYSSTNLIGSNVFCANGKILVDAVREYANKKDWIGDKYFYFAEKL